jgi:hypothetical protein
MPGLDLRRTGQFAQEALGCSPTKHIENMAALLFIAHATLSKKLQIVLFDNTFAKLLTRRRNKRSGSRTAPTEESLTGGAQ